MKKLFVLLIACFLPENCVSGLEIRLTYQLGVASGSSPVNGYVEIFYNGIWIPICADNWQQTGSEVLCRMLGYNTSSHYRAGYYIPSIYNISCTGTERSLEECIGGIGYQYYNAYSDLAYVRCGAGNKTSTDMNPTGLGVRLVGAANPYEGRVELFAFNGWMSVYAINNTWSDREAAVVCRTLGFSTVGSKSFKINVLNNVRCSGQEKSLDQCVYNTVDCTSENFIHLQCGCIVYGCSGSGNYCDIIRNKCVTACSPGSYYTGYCEPCSVGTYQPLQNQWYYCSQCPAGTYQNRTGQTVCIACPSGSYQAKAGQTSCDICLPGTYQNQIGQTSCNPCPAGTYQYWSGQTSCLACDLGTYQNVSGQVVCLQCGKDKTTDRTGIDSYSDCHDEQPTEQDGRIGQPQMNLVIMGGSLMIGIAVVNIIVCIVVLKRTCLKTGKPTTRMSKSSLPVRRRNEYVSENPARGETANSANSRSRQTDKTGEEQYEVCERH